MCILHIPVGIFPVNGELHACRLTEQNVIEGSGDPRYHNCMELIVRAQSCSDGSPVES